MIEFTITSQQILGVCAFITAVFGAWKIVKEVKKPSDDLKKQVEKHEQLLDNDNKRLLEIEQSNKMILQALLVSINHDITGNGIERMTKVRDQLQEYLIDR